MPFGANVSNHLTACRLLRGMLLCAVLWCSVTASANSQETQYWQAGFAKIDITPDEPVRMAGYGSRDRPSEGVDTNLYARCVAIRRAGSDKTIALVTVDNIGLPGLMTRELAEILSKRHGLSRDQVVFCSTHTHTGPDLVSQLAGIFSKPMSQKEVDAGKRYKAQLHEAILESVTAALDDLSPASLFYGVGETTFAANRRVLSDGRWSGFGVQPGGPVDHSVPVLRITDGSGKVRGLVFNYACHCTTLGGDHYRINGDWAGYACAKLEAEFEGAVALSTIGCGADANPNPRGSLELAEIHGTSLAEEVTRVAKGSMQQVTEPPQTRFDYAALSFDLPTREELRARLDDRKPQVRRHAQNLLQTYEEKGRLPATYPVPIQSWKFGDQLTMIFLGGEVVVDYALRLKKLLDDQDLWVSAYANDVLGYIASERMRSEGGYEFDSSGIYYGLPGPWASGSEDLLIESIEKMLNSRGRAEPLSPDDALQSFNLLDGFRIDLVAAEPLVSDPINIAFDPDGRLWVVEMGGYPEATAGGRIKVLTDENSDGTFDTAETFIEGISFPTGVQPWRDGILISAAPAVLFARDTNGDGKADDVRKMLDGFELSNPQHRVSGFTYGLDHSLHLASGDNQDEITSVKSGRTVDASGHDLQFWPDSGEIATTSGRSQFMRSRDDWGRWFGNNNSRPMYHYPIDDHYLERNAAVGYSSNVQQLFDPPVAPPVFPVTAASQRFNDLYAANRFTSACSSIVARSPELRANEHEVAFICEPVHNLIHRAVLLPDGASFRATRSEAEQAREFLASSDPWCRPVRTAVGPDGSLWVVDMYREVIEHPKWIPDAWQQQLDLYAGKDRGRIYRISPDDQAAGTLPNFRSQSTEDLLNLLRSPIGTLRDLAQQVLLERSDDRLREALIALASEDEQPLARVHALWMLQVQGWLKPDLLLQAFEDDHPGVLEVAVRLSEPRLEQSRELLTEVASLATHSDASVVLRAALALGGSPRPEATDALATIATRPDLDRWMAMAVSSSARGHAGKVLAAMLKEPAKIASNETALDLVSDLYATAQAENSDVLPLVRSVFKRDDLAIEVKLRLASAMTSGKGSDDLQKILDDVRDQAWEIALDPASSEALRQESLELISASSGTLKDERRQMLMSLLEPTTPSVIQEQAIECLLKRADSINVARQLVERWHSFSQAVREYCIQGMLSRRETAEQLLDFLESQELRINDLSPVARQQLLQSGTRSMKVRAARLVGNTSSKEKAALIRNHLEEISSIDSHSSDVGRSQQLFQKHCATCHLPNDKDLAIGPSLANLTDRSDRALLEAILDPSRSVDPKYQSYVVQTDEGRILVGVIESEVGRSLTLAHADGKRTTIDRGSIEQMKGTGLSLMPEGFEKTLSTEDLAAILDYLQQGN